MTQPKDGGPAFPRAGSDYVKAQEGMSLRDWFAGQALQGIVHRNPTGCTTLRHSIKFAYQYADMMIAERERESKIETEREQRLRKSEDFSTCLKWAKENGLQDTRALKVIGRAGISDFSQITRVALEGVTQCGEKTIELIFRWKRSREEARSAND